MQLRKLCNHPFVFEEVESAVNPTKINNDSLWRTAGKFELLDRLLPKFFHTGHKVSWGDVSAVVENCRLKYIGSHLLPNDANHEHYGRFPSPPWI